MKRFTLFTPIVVLAIALFAPATAMAIGGHGGHGFGGHGYGGHGYGGHGFGGHGFGGHGYGHGFGGHGYGGHGFGISLGHHYGSYYSYPYYGYGASYYPSYYYPSYSGYYAYPSDYGVYADSYYCGRPRAVYRTAPPVEEAPPPSDAPAPAPVPDESPNPSATHHEQPNVVSSRAQGRGLRLAVSAVRPIVTDEESPWIAGGDDRPNDDRGSTVAISAPVHEHESR